MSDTFSNPFTPSFGTLPSIIAGRSDLLSDMQRAFTEGPGNPNLATILVGARGAGKTALLTAISNYAREEGWICASTSALPGMLEDLEECAYREASHLIDVQGKQLSSIEIGNVIGLGWENTPSRQKNWRSRMTDLLDALAQNDTGILFVVDEVKPELDEMKTLVSVYQHFVREGRKVSLCLAGLPYRVSSLLSNEDVSFLRRARKRNLGRIPNAEIARAFEMTIQQAGGTVEHSATDLATEAIGGFAYMLQLVGYWTWETARSSADAALGGQLSITAEHAVRGVQLAQSDLAESVLETTWNELSPVDKKFLASIVRHSGDVALADVAADMGVKSNYATKYKKRLLEQGVIGEYGRNMLRLEIPGSKEYFETRLGESSE